MSGSEVEVWTNRDTSSGGFERNDEEERAATAKGHLAMRAATREKMISIMAEAGLAGGLSAIRKLPVACRLSGSLADARRLLLHALRICVVRRVRVKNS